MAVHLVRFAGRAAGWIVPARCRNRPSIAIAYASLGLAYGSLGESDLSLENAAKGRLKAAAEFQKILDHPGIVLADPIGALAHDPDIPILTQARAEYARLF
jgi:hypothetical protein